MNEFGKHLDEPREIGKKKEKVSAKDKMMVQVVRREDMLNVYQQVKLLG